MRGWSFVEVARFSYPKIWIFSPWFGLAQARERLPIKPIDCKAGRNR